MTVSEMRDRVGQTATLRDGSRPGMSYDVLILDAKEAYSILRYLVQPLNGTGKAWVVASSLRFDK